MGGDFNQAAYTQFADSIRGMPRFQGRVLVRPIHPRIDKGALMNATAIFGAVLAAECWPKARAAA